jgi:hypothetical protein
MRPPPEAAYVPLPFFLGTSNAHIVANAALDLWLWGGLHAVLAEEAARAIKGNIGFGWRILGAGCFFYQRHGGYARLYA